MNGLNLESNLSQYLLKSLESDVLKDGCVALEGIHHSHIKADHDRHADTIRIVTKVAQPLVR
jgi:hypothetical protein